MIDSSFIIDYTNALYSADKSVCPTYNEFRDMFSSGQIKSKQWAVQQLSEITDREENILVVGSWYGTLGMMLTRLYPYSKITLLDIDPRCSEFTKNVFCKIPNVHSITQDMYLHCYTESLIVNTSCEHISSLKDWLNLLPTGTRVLLQSNNSDKIEGHINCSQSISEFIEKADLSEIEYSGELVLPMYTRYMIIGKV